MEDKEYLIEAIIPSAKNVAANLGLKGKNITQWDLIINGIVTLIHNDSYNPTLTYSTPKKGTFGYSYESLQSIADQMVALIKSSKKSTSTPKAALTLTGSKYKDKYDWDEEWNNNYSTGGPYDTPNKKIFNDLIDNVIQALDEVQSLDNTTLLKGFKGKKENITSIKSELNSLKDNYNENNYYKFISILGNLGIDSNKIHAYFKPETDNQESTTSTVTPGAISIDYKGKTVKYYDNPFDKNYGKNVYEDKTYNDLNKLGEATQDSDLIKTIINKRNENNKRFEIHDLNNLTSFYDLTFDDNGKYYDVSAVYNIPEFEYILAKTDDINKTKWEDLELYGVKDGKIIKIDKNNLSENLTTTWYNYDYDPNDLKKLLNKRDIGTQKADAAMMKELSEIENKGFPLDNKIIKDGEYVSVLNPLNWWADDPRDSEIIEAFLNSIENGNMDPFLDFFKKNTPTVEQQKDFFTKLYNSATLELRLRIKNIMDNLEIYKKGGALKFTEGGKSEENKVEEKTPVYTQNELINAYNEREEKGFGSKILDWLSSIGAVVALKNKNKKARLLGALMHTAPSVAADINEGDVDENTLATIINGISLAVSPNQKINSDSKIKNYTNKIWPYIRDTYSLGTQINNLGHDGWDWSDIPAGFNVLIGTKYAYKNAKNTHKRNKQSNSNANVNQSSNSNTPPITSNKLGGQLNYLKIF